VDLFLIIPEKCQNNYFQIKVINIKEKLSSSFFFPLNLRNSIVLGLSFLVFFFLEKKKTLINVVSVYFHLGY